MVLRINSLLTSIQDVVYSADGNYVLQVAGDRLYWYKARNWELAEWVVWQAKIIHAKFCPTSPAKVAIVDIPTFVVQYEF